MNYKFVNWNEEKSNEKSQKCVLGNDVGNHLDFECHC
jgi:hypothetical protein